ncbi:hypothetical protein PBRA_004549 [Plasmodiophora brassicae]|uniref:Uncharacterized protein n=1 Tax=Plasmodiophora brassicae TaxID=37360 RepID=A0A0G4IKQ4_PLABS|nr:hypothetical protein PBRA_004549 [Plasmodiophora brassicae]
MAFMERVVNGAHKVIVSGLMVTTVVLSVFVTGGVVDIVQRRMERSRQAADAEPDVTATPPQ